MKYKAKSPVLVVTVRNVEELEALMASPAIRQDVTRQRLQEIIQVHRKYNLGEIRVKIHDNRDGVPGITWTFFDDQGQVCEPET